MLKNLLTVCFLFAAALLRGEALVIGDATCGAPAGALQHAAIDYALKSGHEISFRQIKPQEALSRLQSGVLDILLIERRFVPQEISLQQIPFAAEALTCYIYPENPLQNLRKKDVLDILSSPSPDWSNYLGLKIKIQRIALKNSSPGGQLINRIFGEKDFAPEIFRVSSSEQLFKFLNAAAIGFAPYQSERPLGALPVKIDNILPDRKTVSRGEYPLTLRYDLVFLKKNSGKLSPFFELLFQEKYREKLEDSFLLPLSLPFRPEPL